jgi:hypothetical protein
VGTLARPLTAALATLVVALSLASPGLRAAPVAPVPVQRLTLPGVANDAPHAPSRSFAMGFAHIPPVPSVEGLLQIVPEIAKVSEYTIIQREVPWTRIVAGTPMSQVIDEEYQGLVDFLRGNGLKLVLLVDPLDGLGRTHEAVETTKNGLSLLDPNVRSLHEEWVRQLVSRFHPEYIGLASEINTLGAHGDQALYVQIRSMVNTLAPQLRAISPGSKVFVSFQVEDAWGLPPLPPSDADQWAMTRDFDVDVVGLSSYPGFVSSDPSQIPPDYYRRFALAGGKPLAQFEGGWTSEATGGLNSTPALQASYFRQLFDLLDSVEAELVVLLTYADLDLANPIWGLPPDRQAILLNFARMGIVDIHLQPRPAYAVWQDEFRLPLAGP